MLFLLLNDVLNKMADPSSYDAALQGQEWWALVAELI